jgi:RNA polymerase sigma-70 factor (ECF subfamily)
MSSREKSMSSMNDGELIERILGGKQDCFAHLVKKYQSPLFSFAMRMIYHHEAARDMIQETFISAYRNIASFRGSGTFSAWLYRITANKCINYLKREKKVAFESFDELQERVPPGGSRGEGNPEREYEKKELKARIEKELQKLNTRQRMVFNLYYLTGYSYRDIGTITGMSEGKVKSDLFRARQNLRKNLDDLWKT